MVQVIHDLPSIAASQAAASPSVGEGMTRVAYMLVANAATKGPYGFHSITSCDGLVQSQSALDYELGVVVSGERDVVHPGSDLGGPDSCSSLASRRLDETPSAR